MVRVRGRQLSSPVMLWSLVGCLVSVCLPGWATLVSGLLVTGVVAGLLHYQTRQQERLEHLILARTVELSQTAAALAAEIQQRNLVETRLRRKQAWLALIQSAAGIEVWSWDVQSNEIRLSKHHARPQELGTGSGLSFEDWLSTLEPEDQQRITALFAGVLTSPEKSFEAQYEVRLPDGRKEWRLMKGEAGADGTVVHGATVDISGLKRSEQALRDSEDRFRRAYLDGTIGMIMLDLQCRILAVNRALARLGGYDDRELIGTSILEMIVQEDRANAAGSLRSLLRGECSSYQSERRVLCKDGRMVNLRLSVSLLFSGGEPESVFILCEDVTEQIASRQQLQYQATHDAMTGLLNRQAFETALAQELARAGAGGESLALLYIDLDGFKFVNDSLGHSVGDRLLPAVAARLREALPSGCTVARVGGDEFTAIVAADRETAATTAARVIAAISERFVLFEYELSVGASVGIAMYPEDTSEHEELLQSADTAMYAAKREGKGQYCFVTNEMRAANVERLELERHLRRALPLGQLQIHYQPIVDVNGQLVRFEALSRWNHPDWGAVAPIRFIPVAEETGLIVPIGNWVLAESCRQMHAWNRCLAKPIQIAVNVSAVQFCRPDFLAQVEAALRDSCLEPHLLELELTESVFMGDVDGAILKMNQLKRLGVAIAVDDFGTGYSSLSYLRQLPLTTVKVDRSFVKQVGIDRQSGAVVESVISLAHGLGMRVVSEGVETALQAEVLSALGCDELQGYYFGHPGSAESTGALIRAAAASAQPEVDGLAILAGALDEHVAIREPARAE